MGLTPGRSAAREHPALETRPRKRSAARNRPGSCVQGLLPCTPVRTQVLLLWGHAAPRGAHPVQTQFPRGAHAVPGRSPTPGVRGRGWVRVERRHRSIAQTRGALSAVLPPKKKHYKKGVFAVTTATLG